jgi:hypothetical protein
MSLSGRGIRVLLTPVCPGTGAATNAFSGRFRRLHGAEDLDGWISLVYKSYRPGVVEDGR